MDIFEKTEKYIAIVLVVLMGIVVIAAAAEIAYEIVTGLIQPPGFFLDVTELIDTFGLFLMVLIGLELSVRRSGISELNRHVRCDKYTRAFITESAER